MPLTRDRVTVYPPAGEALTVDISDMSGATVVAYTTRDGGQTHQLPVVISTVTAFWMEPRSGPYDVSAKLAGLEIAGASTPVRVYDFPTALRPTLSVTEAIALAAFPASPPA